MNAVPVNILFFAQARELSGVSRAVLQVPERILVRELLNLICDTFSLQLIKDSVILSVDEEYCSDPEQRVTLRPNSEIAVIPPISGG